MHLLAQDILSAVLLAHEAIEYRFNVNLPHTHTWLCWFTVEAAGKGLVTNFRTQQRPSTGFSSVCLKKDRWSSASHLPHITFWGTNCSARFMTLRFKEKKEKKLSNSSPIACVCFSAFIRRRKSVYCSWSEFVLPRESSSEQQKPIWVCRFTLKDKYISQSPDPCRPSLNPMKS